ncbi:MAG: amidohydrolase [Clostridium sp.]
MSARKISLQIKDYIIDLRRTIHENPELGLKEFKTRDLIVSELQKENIKYDLICETGVIAYIEGKNTGNTVALRADMDALPIKEETSVEYKSKNTGVMHACGHDAHTAMLLGAAKILNNMKENINGRVKLIFQPAEEIGGASGRMLKQGMLDDVSTAFAIHVLPDTPSGKASVQEGQRMAGTDGFRIKVKGKSGHGSMPHQGVDALFVASSLVVNLQALVSREINPLDSVVITIGTFHSGNKGNILAGEAELIGTVRYFNKDLKKVLSESFSRIVTKTVEMYRAEVELEYRIGINPTVNDKECSRIAERALIKIAGEEAVYIQEKIPTGEDFSLYLERVPGVLAFLGVGNKKKNTCYPLHSDKFNIDEDALELGSALYSQYAIEYLSEI